LCRFLIPFFFREFFFLIFENQRQSKKKEKGSEMLQIGKFFF